ncbi:breast cancer metastasis-suppressor 1 isoform X2 [Myotis daubentonii]|uniref:breast cancer metastasis-suppressor 1 isoform X2 n=1 Tax=Myotis daubentonii TaxID=98922 RepID=UPI002873CE25|nr:breast cancer metastasis-suppressor 1 isoform X2 [Myotis daubentonii]
MPLQPSSKDTEEMEAEGDSAAEMNGEEEESEEERSGSQTESEEESSEMDDEDYERRRSECVSEMLDLEKQFSELKEKARSCCSMTRCRGSCRSGSRGWRRTARAWTSARSGGMTNCTPEAAQGPGTPCHPARGRRHPSFLALTSCTCCRRSTSWRTGRLSKRLGRLCPLRRENQMDPDPAIHSQRAPLEQQAPKPGLTFSCCSQADGQALGVFPAGSPVLLCALPSSPRWSGLLLLLGLVQLWPKLS